MPDFECTIPHSEFCIPNTGETAIQTSKISSRCGKSGR